MKRSPLAAFGWVVFGASVGVASFTIERLDAVLLTLLLLIVYLLMAAVYRLGLIAERLQKKEDAGETPALQPTQRAPARQSQTLPPSPPPQVWTSE